MKAPSPYDLRDRRVWLAGSRGLVGSALLGRLRDESLGELITSGSGDVDLRRQSETESFIAQRRPHVVLLVAGRVGGIGMTGRAQARFLYENVMIGANIIEAARRHQVEKLLIVASAAVYPMDARQPLEQDSLLAGPLEPEKEGYALAKVVQMRMAEMYRREYGLESFSLVPPNLFGPHDDFDPRTAHVLPALIARMVDAKRSGRLAVDVWGSGDARREFLFVDDFADAVLFCLRNYGEGGHINVGAGKDVSIHDLASIIADVVGWEGHFEFQPQEPEGRPRRLLDSSTIRALGWEPKVSLHEGIRLTFDWYRANEAVARRSSSTVPSRGGDD